MALVWFGVEIKKKLYERIRFSRANPLLKFKIIQLGLDGYKQYKNLQHLLLFLVLDNFSYSATSFSIIFTRMETHWGKLDTILFISNKKVVEPCGTFGTFGTFSLFKLFGKSEESSLSYWVNLVIIYKSLWVRKVKWLNISIHWLLRLLSQYRPKNGAFLGKTFSLYWEVFFFQRKLILF